MEITQRRVSNIHSRLRLAGFISGMVFDDAKRRRITRSEGETKKKKTDSNCYYCTVYFDNFADFLSTDLIPYNKLASETLTNFYNTTNLVLLNFKMTFCLAFVPSVLTLARVLFYLGCK